MTEAAPAHVVLAAALRRLGASVRDTRERFLASESAPSATDDDALHDFRVTLRRIRTYLRVARFLWNSKRIERIEYELRYFARTTGTLRDDEVLRDTLASLRLPEIAATDVHAWLARRARVARSRRRSILRIVREGPPAQETDSRSTKTIRPLDNVLDKLDRHLDVTPDLVLSTSELARDAIERAARDVREAARAKVVDEEAMHALRIREKRLRYTTELFADELGEDAPRLLQHATKMQRRLGDLHDLDEALRTVARARGLAMPTKQAAIAALRIARKACAAKVEPHLIDARELEAQRGSSHDVPREHSLA